MRAKVRPDRDKFVAFYVTEDEKAFIVDEAKKKDMSISDYCRKVLTGTIKINLEEDEHYV